PPRDQSCMMNDFAFWFCSARIEASRAQLSTVSHMTSTSPLRKAASLVAGSSKSTNFTSSPYLVLNCEPGLGSMPLLKTMPGEWPAQVLMATTSGRSSLPPASAVLAGVTPSEPLPRSGSAGALPRASKSPLFTVSVVGVPAAPFLPRAQILRSGANLRTAKNAATSSATTTIAFPMGVSFIVYLLLGRGQHSQERVHGGAERVDETLGLDDLLHHGAHVAGDFGRAELGGADAAQNDFKDIGKRPELRHHALVALLAFEQQIALLLQDADMELAGAGGRRLRLRQILELLDLLVHLAQPRLDGRQRRRGRRREAGARRLDLDLDAPPAVGRRGGSRGHRRRRQRGRVGP